MCTLCAYNVLRLDCSKGRLTSRCRRRNNLLDNSGGLGSIFLVKRLMYQPLLPFPDHRLHNKWNLIRSTADHVNK